MSAFLGVPLMIAHLSGLGELSFPVVEQLQHSKVSPTSLHQDIAQVDNINPQLQVIDPKPENSSPANLDNPPNPDNASNSANHPSDSADKSKSENYNPFNQFIAKNFSINSVSKGDSSGQKNQQTDIQFSFEAPNQDLLRFNTGFQSLKQPHTQSVLHIPLELVWSRQIKPITLEIGGGIHYFDRLSASPSFYTKVQYPVFAHVNSTGKLQSLLAISGEIEHSIDKSNPKTIENGIRYWRFQPSIFWQITPNTTLFTLGQVGKLSDSNLEFQSFSRLEHKFDQLEDKFGIVSVATNLFTWSFQQNLGAANGYFSPPDFLVYTLELGWSKDLTSNFSCGINFAQGQQRSSGKFVQARSLQSNCKIKVSQQTHFILGYNRSNVANSNGGAGIVNQSFSGNLSVSF
jgi:hypothetical protein